MRFEEYTKYDAIALAEMLRDKRVSRLELLDALQEGMDLWGHELNAIIEAWLPQARAGRIDFNTAGPLAGVPFLLKDMVEWQGHEMTLGSRLLKGYVSQQTHPLVTRYLQAGLVPVGRTNMSELGLLPTTEPDFYGPTQNPWARAHSPGGSSGGSAAAVAAGLVPAAHAADGGGSIRIPASACGIFGIKPTRGQVVEAIDEVPEGFVSHHCVSRSVRDSALLLDLCSGPSPGSRWRAPTGGSDRAGHFDNFLQAAERDPTPLRLGVMFTDFLGQPIHADCRAGLEHSVKLLESLGHTVEEVRPPFDGLAFRHAFSRLWAVAASFFLKRVRAEMDSMQNLPRPLVRALQLPGALQATLLAAQAAGHPLIEPLTLRLARLADRMVPSDLWVLWQDLNLATAGMAAFFEQYDALVTTTLARPPWKTHHYDGMKASLEVLEDDLFSYAGMTSIANTAGLPAMSVPLFSKDGLPIGTHFIGPHAADAMLLSLAGQLERAQPWHKVATP